MLRAAKQTLDARKQEIRALSAALKKVQVGAGAAAAAAGLAGLGLSGSLDGARLPGGVATAERDGPMREGMEVALAEAEGRERRAMHAATSTRRKLERALAEVVNLREEVGVLKMELRRAISEGSSAEFRRSGVESVAQVMPNVPPW